MQTTPQEKHMQLKDTGERVIEDANSSRSPMFLRHMAAYRFAQPYVQGQRVLECGSGSGYGSAFLAHNGAQRVVGVDISEEAITFARQRYAAENLEFRSADITHLDFPNGAFDVVTSFQVIEHVPDDAAFVRQIRRVLKASGVALISTPNKRTYSPNTPGPENPFHVREYYLNQYQELLMPHFAHVDIMGVDHSPRAAELSTKLEHTQRMIKGSPFLAAVKKMVPKPIKRWLDPARRAPMLDASDYTVGQANPESCLDFIAVCKTA
jgi:2-polyprenyl-3-methyl-5-hydroxy-6-metoxy-1,4-benzoquinol methylase